LGVAILLQGVGEGGFFCGISGSIGEVRSESSAQVTGVPLVTGVSSYLCFHTHYFIAGIEFGKGKELIAVAQITVARGGCACSIRVNYNPLSGEDLAIGTDIGQWLDALALDEGVVTVPAASVGLLDRDLTPAGGVRTFTLRVGICSHLKMIRGSVVICQSQGLDYPDYLFSVIIKENK